MVLVGDQFLVQFLLWFQQLVLQYIYVQGGQQIWVLERFLVGVNGLDMISLRFFDFVIFFIIKKGEIIGEVWMFLGKVVQFVIIDNKDGIVIVWYVFSEVGLYEMDICYDNMYILGSFLQFYVDYVNCGYVIVYGFGFIYGVVNKFVIFIVNIKDVGEGGLFLVIEGLFKVEISCIDNQDGICSVFYLFVLLGDYSILVKYNEQYILGSFFMVWVIGDDFMCMFYLKVGFVVDIFINILEMDFSLLMVIVVLFLGWEEFCLLKWLCNGYVGILFVFKEIGEYLVYVKKNGQYVVSSFILVVISQLEIGDVSCVWVFGQGFYEGYIFEFVEFIIDI